MHSFEFNIRISQHETSFDHLGEHQKRMHQLNMKNNASIVLLYDTACLAFLLYIKSFHIYKFTQVKCSLCTENKISSTTAFRVSETLMRCAKEVFKLLFS